MRRIAMLLFPDFQLMDVVGPWEVFAMWQKVLQAPIELCFVAESRQALSAGYGISFTPDYDFDDLGSVDYLIVPGGSGRLTQVSNSRLLQFLQHQAVTCQLMLSVCTGLFILQAAGLTQDLSVTTYWRALPELALSKQTVLEERLVKHDKIWTAGGVTSGIDLALELIAEIADDKTAGKVQLLLEYYPTKKIFGDLASAQELPDYNTTAAATTDLPQYIKSYLK